MKTRRQVLATDLDGTLIPLQGNQQNRIDLKTLTRELETNGVTLALVTGRYFGSVMRAINEFQLPVPECVICDVGTSIYVRDDDGQFQRLHEYEEHLQPIIHALPIASLRKLLESIAGLRLQEPEKQGPFKLSFYSDASEMERLVDQIQTELDGRNAPYSIIHSIDPLDGGGLIDLLPAQASKAYALEWWANYAQLQSEDIVFAGDSGNDLAALTAGHRAIVVANADHRVIQHAYNEHREAGWPESTAHHPQPSHQRSPGRLPLVRTNRPRYAASPTIGRNPVDP